jgi:peptidoglycan/xylan/chitin deacetylase (PgdA/CDA1 family)
VRPSGYVSQDEALDGSLVTAEMLRAQIQLLQANYEIISPELFLRSLTNGVALPERAVLLTCDDGVQNTVTDMLPVLRECGVSCLFFITGASLAEQPGMLWYEELKLMLREAPPGAIALQDGESRWNCAPDADRHVFWWSVVRDVSQRDAQGRAMFLEHVRETLGLNGGWRERYRNHEPKFRRFFLLARKDLLYMQDQGMTIGAHTLSHPLLSRVSEGCARSEIEGSRTLLEQALGRPVQAFAYPFGNSESVTARDLELAEEAGFRCAFLNVGGGFGADLPRFALPRVHVTSNMGLGEFEAHVSGFYRRLRGTPAIPTPGERA